MLYLPCAVSPEQFSAASRCLNKLSAFSQKKRSGVILHLEALQCTAVSSPGALSRVDCLKSSCRTKYPGLTRKRDLEVCICAVYTALFSSKSLSRPNFCHQCPATSSQWVSYCLTALQFIGIHYNARLFTALQVTAMPCSLLQILCRAKVKIHYYISLYSTIHFYDLVLFWRGHWTVLSEHCSHHCNGGQEKVAWNTTVLSL